MSNLINLIIVRLLTMRKKLYYYLQREDIEMDNIFCKNLKSARIKAGMTQEQIASAVGVAVTTYSNWELGKREPNVLKIKALAKALGVTGDYLLGLEPIDQLERDFDALKSKFGEDRLAAYFEALKKVIE